MAENQAAADNPAENDVRSVFLGILKEEGLDNREKKSAIIDFISAGIETVFYFVCIIFVFLLIRSV